VPRHPPNALLSLKIKDASRNAPPPCTETILRKQSSVFSRQLSETTGTGHRHLCRRTIPCRIISLSTQQTPLNTVPRSREDPSPTSNPRKRKTTSGQTCDRGAPRDAPEPDLHSKRTCPHTMETPPTASPARPQNNLSQQLAPEQCRQHRTSCFSVIQPLGSADQAGRHPTTSTPSPERRGLVEVIGLEPTTPCLQSRCSPS
jgi:hypothetical protein